MLCQSIEALCDQTDPGCLYEIIPVDNGSRDDTRQVVQKLARNSPVPIKYVYEPKAGSHFARNTGFKNSKGEILGLIDDDVIVENNWIKNIVRVYDNPAIGCAGGKLSIRWLNGSPPKWIKPYKRVLGEIDYGEKSVELQYPQMINAGNFSIRKKILYEVGGYNPCNAPKDRLVGDGECGLCLKVYHLNTGIFWVADAIGWHMLDAKQITLSYMRRRAKFNGMSRAYTYYRAVDGRFPRIVRNIFHEIVHAVFHLLRILIHNKSRNPVFYDRLFKYEKSVGFISYLLKIITHRRLRELVRCNNWISN